MFAALRLCTRYRSNLIPTTKYIVRSNGTGNHTSQFKCVGLGTTRLSVVKSVPIRCIQTSASKRSPLKFVILFLRPIVSIVGGRLFRKWWLRLTPEQRLKYSDMVKRHRWKLYFGIVSYGVTLFVYYLYHCQKTPFTERVRFMAFDGKAIKEMTAKAAEDMLSSYGNKIVPPGHPDARRVLAVTRRIVDANSDLPQLKGVLWEVTLVDEPGIMNAMVTPDGRIIVFKDILQACATDDELAIVISHEISHALLDHIAEKISNAYLMGFLTAPFLAVIWAMLPSDLMSIVVTFIYDKIIAIATELPYSRLIETEADDVGLQLAARACVDVRQSVDFWKRMDELDKHRIGLAPGATIPTSMEYFQTHPLHETRWKKLESQLQAALVMRDSCHCPPLPKLVRAKSYKVVTRVPNTIFVID